MLAAVALTGAAVMTRAADDRWVARDDYARTNDELHCEDPGRAPYEDRAPQDQRSPVFVMAKRFSLRSDGVATCDRQQGAEMEHFEQALMKFEQQNMS